MSTGFRNLLANFIRQTNSKIKPWPSIINGDELNHHGGLPFQQTNCGRVDKRKKSVDESHQQSVGDKQSVGEASPYEKRRQLLTATNQYDSYVKAATERSQKSRSEKELR